MTKMSIFDSDLLAIKKWLHDKLPQYNLLCVEPNGDFGQLISNHLRHKLNCSIIWVESYFYAEYLLMNDHEIDGVITNINIFQNENRLEILPMGIMLARLCYEKDNLPCLIYTNDAYASQEIPWWSGLLFEFQNTLACRTFDDQNDNQITKLQQFVKLMDKFYFQQKVELLESIIEKAKKFL